MILPSNVERITVHGKTGPVIFKMSDITVTNMQAAADGSLRSVTIAKRGDCTSYAKYVAAALGCEVHVQ